MLARASKTVHNGRRLGASMAVVAVIGLVVLVAGLAPAIPAGSTTATQALNRPEEPSSAALADAIRFRTNYGLRADEAWIRQVALDPAARAGLAKYGVPLMPGEIAELASRAASWAEVGGVLRGYGASHYDEFGGVFRDLSKGDLAVIWLTGDLPAHEAAIRTQLNPQARFEVRQARWTLRDLDSLLARVEGDENWFTAARMPLSGSGISIALNAIEIKVRSKDPSASERILDHFNGQGWLVVEPDGIGVWSGGRGTIVIRAVDKENTPVPDLMCAITPDDRAALLGEDAWSTNDEGICRIPNVGATGYTVMLKKIVRSDWQVVGQGRVRVAAGGASQIRIVVDG